MAPPPAVADGDLWELVNYSSVRLNEVTPLGDDVGAWVRVRVVVELTRAVRQGRRSYQSHLGTLSRPPRSGLALSERRAS